MKSYWQRFMKDNRGVATSLLEAATVIAISAILGTTALLVWSDDLTGASIQTGNSEVKLIGISILSFIQDTGSVPAFKSGQAVGPNDNYFLVLATGGAEPTDLTGTWPKDAKDRDLLDHHINRNNPAGSGIPYLRMGEISYARFKGWNGPYMSRLPAADPWGDKYLVNIGLHTTKGSQLANLPTGRRPAVFVLSAGANRTIETKFMQPADEFLAGGDDHVFRIQ